MSAALGLYEEKSTAKLPPFPPLQLMLVLTTLEYEPFKLITELLQTVPSFPAKIVGTESTVTRMDSLWEQLVLLLVTVKV